MLIPIFPKPVPFAEVDQAARKLQIRLPIASRMESPKTQSSTDQGMLTAVVQLLALAPVQLKMILEKGDMQRPLMDVFVSGSHIIAAVYEKEGIAFLEALDPADLKQLLMQSFVLLPFMEKNDQKYVMKAFPEAALEMMKSGLMPEGVPQHEAGELIRSVAQNHLIHCVMRKNGKQKTAVAVAGQTQVFTLMEEDDGGLLIAGTPIKLLQELNMWLLMAFREILKTE
ncbi:MAG: hypothetical protein IKU70_03995 [Clostridia bacterium]|nr:hypothetical protein [Clostridia bacterium]